MNKKLTKLIDKVESEEILELFKLLFDQSIYCREILARKAKSPKLIKAIFEECHLNSTIMHFLINNSNAPKIIIKKLSKSKNEAISKLALDALAKDLQSFK